MIRKVPELLNRTPLEIKLRNTEFYTTIHKISSKTLKHTVTIGAAIEVQVHPRVRNKILGV